LPNSFFIEGKKRFLYYSFTVFTGIILPIAVSQLFVR